MLSTSAPGLATQCLITQQLVSQKHLKNCFQKLFILGTGAIAQWLRAPAAFLEVLGLVPSTQVGRLTTTSISRSRASNTFF